jgi:hypothetical protein
MISKTKVNNELYINVSESLKNDGFKYIKSKQRIIRKNKEGFDVIIFNVLDYNPIFQIQFWLKTRLDIVENILNRFMYDCMNPKYMALSETTSHGYGELMKKEIDYIEIKSERELKLAIKNIIKLIKDSLIIFEENKDISQVNFNKKNQILFEHKGIHLYHNRRTLMQSLILMILSNDPDFEKLSEKYKELYIPFSGEEITGKKAMNDLILFLKEM